MRPDQVAESYDRIAGQWQGASFDRSNGMAQHRRALAFTPRRGAALDVGCGSSGRILDLLLAQGFTAEGLDLSVEMLRLARESHPQLTFHHADICEWTAPRPYDFISAWDSVWHVPLPMQPSVLLKLCRALTPGGVLIFTAGGVELPEEKLDAHMGVPMYHATLGVPRICSLLAEGGCMLRHFEHDQHPQAHVCFIAQRT
ncbi:MAG: class I SAM-dependent methyltransferase [Rubrivivax sp.]|nr:class I SAM-dependent methyltransferase [Rubrivivax sp.]MDP3613075.1 class I SAM-dependent methyltransferase [Rubrivivax sp.]